MTSGKDHRYRCHEAFHPIAHPAPEAASLTYELRLMQTRAATGYFMPVPQGDPPFAAVLAYLRDHPNDAFMHRYGLRQVMEMPPDQVRRLIAKDNKDPVLMTLLLEACLTHGPLAALLAQFHPGAVFDFRHDSPLLILRSESLPDQDRHRQWTAFLGDNLLHHKPLSTALEACPAPLYGPAAPEAWIPLADVTGPRGQPESPRPLPSLEVVAATALERLEALGILEEGEYCFAFLGFVS